MIFVSWATFDWRSIHPRTLKMMPKSETLVMVATVIVTVGTHNLAIGVGVGVLVAMVMFARRVAHFVTVEPTVRTVDGHETATYVVDGELFFASSNDLYTLFEYALDPEHVVIGMHASQLWDASTIAALDAITEKYRHHGIDVKIIGLNDASVLMRERLGGKLGAGH
ncbi:MAG: sodium-independent anion transporter [Arthrobacter sp.]|nr:sodium-independent anion transporter [Arthrobacter sp.]